MATKQRLKELSYKSNTVYWQVLLADEDIAAYLEEISEIEESLDIPELTEYTASDASFQLNDLAGTESFSPENPNNFFKKKGYPQTGYKTPVEIYAGFVLSEGTADEQQESILLFKGELIEISQTVKTGIFQCTASDLSQTLRTEDVMDFGLEKSYILEKGTGTASGNYPFAPPVSPVSKESVKGYALLGEFVETGSSNRNVTLNKILGEHESRYGGPNTISIVVIPPDSADTDSTTGTGTVNITVDSTTATTTGTILDSDKPQIYTIDGTFNKDAKPVFNVPSRFNNGTKILAYENLTNVQNLDTEGYLDPTDFVIKPEIPSIFQTEGDNLEETANPSTDRTPIPTFKAPYRYKTIDTIVNNLLNHYNILDRDIQVPEIDFEFPYFSANNRVGYDNLAETEGVPNNEQENELSGIITDFVYTEEYPLKGSGAIHGCTGAGNDFYIINNSAELFKIDVENLEVEPLGELSLPTDYARHFTWFRLAGLCAFRGKLYVFGRMRIIGDHNRVFSLFTVDLRTLKLTLVKIDPTSDFKNSHETFDYIVDFSGWGTGLATDKDNLYLSYRQAYIKVNFTPSGIKLNADERMDGWPLDPGLPRRERLLNSQAFEFYNNKAYSIDLNSELDELELDGSNERRAVEDQNGNNLTILTQSLGTYKNQLYAVNNDSLIKINILETGPDAKGSINELTLKASPTFYFLYSSYKGETKPKLIKYDQNSDKFTTVVEFEPNASGGTIGRIEEDHAEWWKLAYKKDDNNNISEFYILGTVQSDTSRIIETDGLPGIASYDSSEEIVNRLSKIKIWKYDVATEKLTVYIDSSRGYPPQLAQSYGGHRVYSLPDSRKNFEYFDGKLYYIWANGDLSYTNLRGGGAARHTFGIAEVTGDPANITPFLIANGNLSDNAASCDFVIDSTSPAKLYATFTFIGTTTSTFKVVSKNIS